MHEISLSNACITQLLLSITHLYPNMDKSDREQRYEKRLGKKFGFADQEYEEEREQQQYNTAESEAEKDGAGEQAGSSKQRSNSSRRNRSTSVGKSAIINFKLDLPVFKGKKKANPDVHIQAFERQVKLKGVDLDEYEDYFRTTLKESAQKWYYHYPPEKLPTYQVTKKAFLLRFREKIDEDILCELGRIKQKDKTIRRYVEKLKDLTRQLEVQP